MSTPHCVDCRKGPDDAKLFLYPGNQHYFADSSPSSYDAEATKLLTGRVLEFLDRALAGHRKRAVASPGASLDQENRASSRCVNSQLRIADWNRSSCVICNERADLRACLSR